MLGVIDDIVAEGGDGEGTRDRRPQTRPSAGRRSRDHRQSGRPGQWYRGRGRRPVASLVCLLVSLSVLVW